MGFWKDQNDRKRIDRKLLKETERMIKNGETGKRVIRERTLSVDSEHMSPDGQWSLRTPSHFGRMLSPFVIDVARKVESDTPLHYAVRSHNQALLRQLLDSQTIEVDVVSKDARGAQPIHLAAEVDNVDALILLLEYGADVHARQHDFYGLQPVHIAAAQGSFDCLKYLVTGVGQSCISHSVDLEGNNPLHWATVREDLRCVELLLELGTRLDAKQTKGPQETPLHLACIKNSLEVVKLMWQNQPEQFEKTLAVQDAEGFLPIHRAVAINNGPLVEFLIDKGSQFDTLDKERRSPLILGVQREAWQASTVLVEKGANPFFRDPVLQRNALHHAAMVGADPRLCPNIVSLLKKGQNAESLDAFDAFGYSPLQYAAGYGNLLSFEALIELGADLRASNFKSRSALHYAAKYGQLLLVKSILAYEEGPSTLNAMDHKGRSPLFMACQNGHHEVVEYLLSKGAFVFRDDLGRTPLHVAAERNHHFILESLMTYCGALLNSGDKDGKTALHVAAASDREEAVDYLLSVGALISHDKFGRTALDLAIHYKNSKAALAFVRSTHWRDIVRLPSKYYGSVVLGLIAHLPSVMKVILDRSVTTYVSSKPENCYVEYDLSILQPLEDDQNHQTINGSHKYRRNGKPIKMMARLGRKELLSHPLCRVLLERKWVQYGMYCSGFLISCNLLFVALLSYVMVGTVLMDLRPHLMRTSYCNVYRHAKHHLEKDFTLQQMKIACNPFDQEISDEYFCSPSYRKNRTLSFHDDFGLTGLVLALAVVLLKEIVEFVATGKEYFKEITNLLELLMFASCGGFLICFFRDDYTGSVGEGTYQFGAIALFLAWTNVLRFCRPFGELGIYSFMFFSILKTLIKVSIFFCAITCAFASSFFIIFHMLIFPDNANYYQANEELDSSVLRTAHHHIHTSGLRIGAMTIGDLESVEFFIGPLMNGMVQYPVLSFFFYAVFMLLMPILLNNLLTGLAIGDMTSVTANAQTLRLETQVTLHEALERLIPRRLMRKFRSRTLNYRYYPARPKNLPSRIARWMQSSGLGDIEDELAVFSHPSKAGVEKDEETAAFSTLDERLKQLSRDFDHHLVLLEKIHSQLQITQDCSAQATGTPLSFSDKVRRRRERLQEDRKHATRVHLGRTNLGPDDSLRPEP